MYLEDKNDLKRSPERAGATDQNKEIKRPLITKQEHLENDSCQYNKYDRSAFFNEKKTACYLARVCIETLLKSCSESIVEDIEEIDLCKIT